MRFCLIALAVFAIFAAGYFVLDAQLGWHAAEDRGPPPAPPAVNVNTVNTKLTVGDTMLIVRVDSPETSQETSPARTEPTPTSTQSSTQHTRDTVEVVEDFFSELARDLNAKDTE